MTSTSGVFATPSCPFCPGAARLAHKLAVESERGTADGVAASGFSDLLRRYDVRGVPEVVIHERVEFAGAQPESRFVSKLLRAATQERQRASAASSRQSAISGAVYHLPGERLP